MKIAVVTGASSGLGREFVRQLALLDKQLDEIWVIARRRDRLEALRAHCRVPLRVLPLDLTAPGAADTLEAALKAAAPEVSILINAAGFGRMGDWQAVGRRESAAMIQLNCQAAVEVTQVCLPFMGRGSRVLEICSTSAFQPLASTARRVAFRALYDSRHEKAVSTPGPVCTVHRLAGKCLPSDAMMALWEGLRRL